MSHSEHAEDLRNLLIAEGDVMHGFESSELAQCGDCRGIVEEHLRLVADLEVLGNDERADFEAADHVSASPGRAEAALREHILGEPTTRPWRWQQLLALAGAALITATLWFLFPAEDVQLDGGGVLGPEARLVHPIGDDVESFVPFRWNVKAPPGGHFILTIEGEGFSHETGRLTAQEWSPEEPLEFPEKIQWTLSVYRAGGSGDPFASFLEWAER